MSKLGIWLFFKTAISQFWYLEGGKCNDVFDISVSNKKLHEGDEIESEALTRPDFLENG